MIRTKRVSLILASTTAADFIGCRFDPRKSFNQLNFQEYFVRFLQTAAGLIVQVHDVFAQNKISKNKEDGNKTSPNPIIAKWLLSAEKDYHSHFLLLSYGARQEGRDSGFIELY